MSISWKLAITMLFIAIIPTMSVGVTAYLTIKEELIAKTTEQINSTVNKQEQEIRSLLRKKQEEATKLTNRYDLQNALSQYDSTNGSEGLRQLEDIILDRKVESSEIQSIYIVNSENKIIASTVTGQVGANDTSNDNAIGSVESEILIKRDERDDINKLYISRKVVVNRKAFGKLIMVFRIDDIVATVQDYNGLGQTGETIVAAKDRERMISLFPLRFDTDAALERELEFVGEEVNENTDLLKDYRGKNIIMSSRNISFADWVVVVKIDSDESLASISQLRDTMLTILVVSSVAIVGIAVTVGRLFAKPIIRIAEVSKRIGGGDFGVQSTEKRNDEIGLLSDSINTMSRSLKDFVSSIESERSRLEAVLNSIEESIIALDDQGRVLIANRATGLLVGKPMKDIVASRINDVIEWRRDLEKINVDYSTDGVRSYDDLHLLDSKGEKHYVRLIITNDGGKNAAQTIVTIHDITQHRELEEMKLDFVSMAAHELRTPLAAIRGYIELVGYKVGESGSVEVKRYLDQGLRSAAELGGLINNLLDVTRIEKGSFSPVFDKLDLSLDLRQAVEDMSFEANKKNIDIEYIALVDAAWVAADAISLHEVINNLLSNAIKYTHKNGSVKVKLEKIEHNFVTTVEDTGIGISESALSRLFTKFYRVRNGLSDSTSGTGLGLYISKSIIERHRGTISVKSREGVGSTFVFTLPEYDSGFDNTKEDNRRRHGWNTKDIAR